MLFLWLMAVGTIICASLWSDFTSAPEQIDERYNELAAKVWIKLLFLFNFAYPWFQMPDS